MSGVWLSIQSCVLNGCEKEGMYGFPKRCDSGIVLRKSSEKGEQNIPGLIENWAHLVIGFLLVSAFYANTQPCINLPILN